MYKIFNLSNHPMDLERFDSGHIGIKNFMRKHRLDGIELIQSSPWNAEVLPAEIVKGMHLRFWPVWLDFWRGNTDRLIKQFGSMEVVKHFYGGDSGKAMVEYYRSELETAKKAGAHYVVFHVSNVEPEHCFNYKFTYTSEEVIEVSIQLLNEAFDGFEGEFDLLFENLWWPGLTLLDSRLAQRLMDGVKYPHKGFMLDISHMMNTNLELESEEQAAGYIIDKYKELGSVAGEIKGIHLNSSLSGNYIKSQLGNNSLKGETDFFKRYCDAYTHILKIDRHIPFRHKAIKKVIDTVKPEYLVYEFLTDKFDELDSFMEMQNKVLDL